MPRAPVLALLGTCGLAFAALSLRAHQAHA